MKKYLYLLLVPILTVVVLGMTVNPYLPYEGDQGGKVAKVVYMVKANTILQPLSGPHFYKDELISFYYLVSAIGYKLIGGDVIHFMNFQSVLMGIVFFTLICILLKKAFGVNYLISWAVFISMPILVITFTYGNEVAFSFTFLTASLLALTTKFKAHRLISLILLSASIFSRPDMVFLVPFWIGWFLYFVESGQTRKETLIIIAKNTLLLSLFMLIYWALFIHTFKLRSPLSFPYDTNPKLFASYLIYSFNPTVAFIGILGLLYLIKIDKKLALLVLLSSFPILFYMNKLSCPKYIITFSFFWGIPATILLQRIKIPYKISVFALIGIWWLLSFTPYGILGPKNGSFMVIMTHDGPLPTGAYFSFYRKIKEGFFGQTYRDDIDSLKLAIDFMSIQKDAVLISNVREYYEYQLVLNNHYNDIDKWKERWYEDSFPIKSDVKYIMIWKYLWFRRGISDQIKPQFVQFLKNGQVRNISDSDKSPFPLLIEIGDTVPKGNDPDLANRILFMIKYYHGYGIVHSKQTSDLLRSTYWVEKTAANKQEQSIYTDNQWSCYSEKVPNSDLWVSEFPVILYKESRPSKSEALLD